MALCSCFCSPKSPGSRCLSTSEEIGPTMEVRSQPCHLRFADQSLAAAKSQLLALGTWVQLAPKESVGRNRCIRVLGALCCQTLSDPTFSRSWLVSPQQSSNPSQSAMSWDAMVAKSPVSCCHLPGNLLRTRRLPRNLLGISYCSTMLPQ